MNEKKNKNWEELRNKVIGLGDQSSRKSYYPELQKKIEDLKASQEDLLTLFDSTHDAIFIHDINGSVFDVNKSMLEMYGLESKEEALHYSIKDYSDSKTPEEQMKAIWDLLKENPDNVVFEWKARKPKLNTVFDVEVALRPVQWKKQSMVVAVVRDITQRKKIENEKNELLKNLAEAKKIAEEANNAKSEFLSNMSHEIRTPMNTIVGMLDIIAEHSLSKEDEELLTTVRKSGSLLLEIINNILDLSKIEAGIFEVSYESFDLVEVLMPLLKMMQIKAEEKGLKFSVTIEKDLPSFVEGDAIHLKQILFNLISNAIKFTSQGSVAFSARQVSSSSEETKCNYMFEVKDTGIGISEELVPYIFERFNQGDKGIAKRFGGTGLGLSISQKLSRLLGGEITVWSHFGEGSCFSLILPFKKGHASENEQCPVKKTDEEVQSLKGKRILLVDDAEENRQLLHLYLRKTGAIIEDAVNGEEACSKFVNNTYDLVLMDIAMPIMDGYAALKFIREYENENARIPLPIIACTAFALNDERDRSLQAGFNYHLPKPITKAALLQSLHSFLKK